MMNSNKKYDLLRVVTHGETPPNCDVTLQINVSFANDGISRGIWNVDNRFINGNGVAMGGFVTSAADIIMAYAIASKLKEGQTFASIDIHTTFHRPALQGDVSIEAKVERMGKKVAYVLANLFQNNKKVASVVSSILINHD